MRVEKREQIGSAIREGVRVEKREYRKERVEKRE